MEQLLISFWSDIGTQGTNHWTADALRSECLEMLFSGNFIDCGKPKPSQDASSAILSRMSQEILDDISNFLTTL